MSPAEAWAGGAVGALALLVCIYLALLMRALRNERIIAMALTAMHDTLEDQPPPQRVLLSTVADTLMAQENAVGRVEVTIHELAQGGYQVPGPEELLTELLALPEPQLLVAEFLREHAGGPHSAAAFSSVAADMVRSATVETFRDLADRGTGESLVSLERLLLLAAEGRIAPVALAGLTALPAPAAPPYRAPRVADLDPAAMAEIARALDATVRRYLRLATLLHGQGEAIVRIRRVAGKPRLAVLRARVLELVRYPPPRRPEFRPGDLAALEIAFDAVGEVVDTAEQRVTEGGPTQAVHLLAGLRVPLPAGLPGRMFHQESLAQVRPLAELGAWHRLAVSRWTAATLQAIAQRRTQPGAFAGAPGRDSTAEGA
ncbi:MAG: hypothetical protein ACRDND_14090 [Streptosporangiaceae bacterium]